jgi:hypothetical protein|tara:strand:+ start:502 stop:705 length:204 start_codon:yes stop_codon:yes gene_type:complete
MRIDIQCNPDNPLEEREIDIEFLYYAAEPNYGCYEDYEIVSPTNLTDFEHENALQQLFDMRACEYEY